MGTKTQALPDRYPGSDSSTHSEPSGVVGYTTREFEGSEWVREEVVADLGDRIIRLEEQKEAADRALALADEFVKWVADNYPKAIREMPTTLYVQMREAGRAFDSTPASTSEEQSDGE